MPNTPVLLTESMELAQTLCRYCSASNTWFVPVSWFGGLEGANLANWPLIKGRQCYYAMIEQPEVGQTKSQTLEAAKACAAKVHDLLVTHGAMLTILDFTEGANGTIVNRNNLPSLTTDMPLASARSLSQHEEGIVRTLADIKDLPPPEFLIDPVIAIGETSLASAAAGVGKTWAFLQMACATAGGARVFAHWKATRPRPVLVVDGEMGEAALGRRLKKIVAGFSETEQQLIAKNLHIVSIGAKAPNLADEKTQREVDAMVDQINRKSGYREKVGLILLDNLVSLVPGSDNETAWSGLCTWIQEYKRQGIAVTLIHHFGKSGVQRGTDLKMAAVDNSFNITPSPKGNGDTIALAIAIDKGRELSASVKKTIHVGFDPSDSAAGWHELHAPGSADDDVIKSRIQELSNSGCSNIQIAAELGMTIDSVKKRKAKFGLSKKRSAKKRPVTAVKTK
jgi:hypothetical protein